MQLQSLILLSQLFSHLLQENNSKNIEISFAILHCTNKSYSVQKKKIEKINKKRNKSKIHKKGKEKNFYCNDTICINF